MAQAEADRRAAETRRSIIAARKRKKAAAVAKIDAVKPIWDLTMLRKVPCKLKVPEIELQLDWHRRHGNAEIIPKKAMLKLKKDKLEVLVKAVESYEGWLGAQHKEEGEEFDLDVSDGSGEESDPELY